MERRAVQRNTYGGARARCHTLFAFRSRFRSAKRPKTKASPKPMSNVCADGSFSLASAGRKWTCANMDSCIVSRRARTSPRLSLCGSMRCRDLSSYCILRDYLSSKCRSLQIDTQTSLCGRQSDGRMRLQRARLQCAVCLRPKSPGSAIVPGWL